ncbi:hypothetical protein SAMN05880582_10115 [Rhizobium sp. RU20A]|uniref:hypothetical protein n=1 Tax=Rhizobium sp. RU20A TaxID=1907412 RepID=UPI0009564F08|nr:hypothetical protein [Rhizobium sp. RU20A]SIP91847.1 hypothetical protein SAMN05880582_10115 [Rhizobium sp. RU20A]
MVGAIRNARETRPSSGDSKLQASAKSSVASAGCADDDDYTDMSLATWKASLDKDVEERFGPTPDELVPTGKAGW